MECCQNQDIKIISGIYTCIKCGLVHGPQLTNDWIEYNRRNVVPYKTLYSRTDYIKRKLRKLCLSDTETKKFMEIWKLVESKLVNCIDKRFPKLDFFIYKILECLDIPKQPTCKISSTLLRKYEIMWQEIV